MTRTAEEEIAFDQRKIGLSPPSPKLPMKYFHIFQEFEFLASHSRFRHEPVSSLHIKGCGFHHSQHCIIWDHFASEALKEVWVVSSGWTLVVLPLVVPATRQSRFHLKLFTKTFESQLQFLPSECRRRTGRTGIFLRLLSGFLSNFFFRFLEIIGAERDCSCRGFLPNFFFRFLEISDAGSLRLRLRRSD